MTTTSNDGTTTEPSVGDRALRLHENPFFPRVWTLVIGIVVALCVALAIYVTLVQTSTSRLASAVSKSDTLHDLLLDSPFYGGPNETETPGPVAEVGAIGPDEANELAIATWIRLLKLVPADTDISAILEDDRLRLLRDALRDGNSCPKTEPDGSVSNARLPVAAPTVDRLVDIARYLADTDCANRSAGDGRDALVSGLVRRIAGLKPLSERRTASCTDLTNVIAIERPDGNGGSRSVAAGCASYREPVPAESGREIMTWLFTESEVYRNARNAAERLDTARNDLDGALAKATAGKERVDEAQAAHDQAANAQQVDAAAVEAARVVLEDAKRALDTLEADVAAKTSMINELETGPLPLFASIYNTREDDTAEGFEDGPLRAVEEFAIALIASVDADPAVSRSRLWLSVWRGYEQFFIIALAAITLSLLLWRTFSFRERSRDIDQAVARIETLALPDADLDAQSGKQHLSAAADRAKALKAEDLHQPAAPNGPPTDIRTELVDAALADLSQLSRYGFSDEHLEHRALDLREKLASSRVGIDWCIAALPAIGFIGTVRGILNALSGVGGLTQGDAAARLQTLLQVSGSLGLAFATTLLALIAMLILSYIDVRQTRYERSLIDLFRDYLGRKILS